MKSLLTHVRSLSGLVVALAVLFTFVSADVSLASPPVKGEDTVNAQAANIQQDEIHLDASYFESNGTIDGLTVTADGLVVAEGQTTGVYVSDVIETSLNSISDIVPLWKANVANDADLRIETRVQMDGAWSGWEENPYAFYPVRNDEFAGNMIWVGGDKIALQIRVTLSGVSNLENITLFFNDTSDGPTDAQIATKLADRTEISANVCPVPEPFIVSRTDWGNPEGQNSPRRPPVYAPTTHIIVHHTETPNSNDYARIVRSIWNFHANCLRWGDIGYNYLIDPNGVIYEGRAGGDDVIGIHDTHNRGSMSIGFIGCYGGCDNPRLPVMSPSSSMLDSAVDLMSWKLDQKKIDPQSRGTYDNLSNIPVIAGGRDVVHTTSPGYNIYDVLPNLRQRVDALVPCVPVTITPPITPITVTPPPTSTVTPPPTSTPAPQACQITDVTFDKSQYKVGETINVTVKLADANGTPLGGAKVDVSVDKTVALAEAEASQSFGFVDRVGEYDGSYNNADVAGTYVFNFRASDPSGANRFAPCTEKDFAMVTAKSKPIENPPTVANAIPDQKTKVNEPYSYTFPANTFSDADGDTLSYSATGLPAGVTFTGASRTFSGTPTATGAHTIVVTADDGNGGKVSDTFVLTVEDIIIPPPTVANAIPDQTTQVNKAYSYTFPANTFSGDALSYTATGLPAGVTFNGASRTFSGTPTVTGAHTIVVTANDGKGGTVSDTFVLTVEGKVNPPPTVANAIPDQTTKVNEPYSYTFPANTFNDVDGDTLSYSATGLPAGVTFNGTSRTFSGTPTITGTYSIVVTADDGKGGKVSNTFVLTVETDVVIDKPANSLIFAPQCTSSGSTTLQTVNAVDLRGVALEIKFDPSVGQVDSIEGNPAFFSAPDNGVVVVENIDNVNGIIRFDATTLGDNKINGDEDLLTINWKSISGGPAQIRVQQLTLVNDENVRKAVNPGVVDFGYIASNCSSLTTGTVALQGRSDNSGVVITTVGGQEIETGVSGNFLIVGDEIASINYPGYLGGNAVEGVGVRSTDTQGNNLLDMGTITLLAGDVNNDNAVNIFDLTYLASRLYGDDVEADLNHDGQINIFDLSLAASNYDKKGPLTNWTR